MNGPKGRFPEWPRPANSILHPVRLRIIDAFLGDRKLTTGDLRTELSDVPAASLYRHVALLVSGGVLNVVSERRVRGAVERTYVLHTPPPISGDELAGWSPEDHRRAFLGYVAALTADFDRYLARGEVDLVGDGVSYRIAAMWLDEDELRELAREFAALLMPRLANAPTPGRSRRMLRTILLPGTEPHSS